MTQEFAKGAYQGTAEREPASQTVDRTSGRTPSPEPWCGASLSVLTNETERRRLCNVRGPHDWHRDRFDSTFVWQAREAAPASEAS